MSGYFEDFQANIATTIENQPFNKKQRLNSGGKVLQENISLTLLDNLSPSKVLSNNLAEKKPSQEYPNSLTNIKNPNVLEKSEMNPFKQMGNNQHENKQMRMDSTNQVDFMKMDSFQKILEESPKKTPDKRPEERHFLPSEKDFSFKKNWQGDNLIRNDHQLSNKISNLLVRPETPLKDKVTDSSLFMVSPGGMPKMFQYVQNSRLDYFSSPSVFASNFPMGLNKSSNLKNNFVNLFNMGPSLEDNFGEFL